MWALILHGGAKEIAPEEEDDNRRGCLAALQAGRAILENGGNAVDAVEESIRVLEDDPTFNAGFGSELNADGEVEMCSAIMDGKTLDVGGVAVVKGVRHPISVAKAMLLQGPILIAAEGARRFAAQNGAELCPPEAMIAPAVAKDRKRDPRHGRLRCTRLARQHCRRNVDGRARRQSRGTGRRLAAAGLRLLCGERQRRGRLTRSAGSWMSRHA